MKNHFQSVHKSPINNSTSKTLYSFPKSDRFEPTRTSPCHRNFYDIKGGALENRTTSFGYGNKISLINKEGVPPPGSYDRKSEFLFSRQKKRGFSFGNDIRPTSEQDINPQNPGPGKYERTFNNYSRISFSFRSKYEDPLDRHKNLLGPGQYQMTPMLNSTGNYFNSKHSNSGCGKIGKSARFQDERTLPPGPGKYDDRLTMNRTGNYFNSKISSNFVTSFQGTSRPPINEKSQAPGPGSYYIFSEFANRNKSPN